MKRQTQLKKMRRWGLLLMGSLVGLFSTYQLDRVEGAGLGGPTHIGTLEGNTTFTTSSSNGINPGLFIEVMDEYGNLTQYESEKGVITIPNTQEGAYVTQAKFLGKTKYVDQDTGEILDDWEEDRNLKLTSVENPVLITTGKNLFDLPLVQGSQTYGDIGGKPLLTYYPFRVTNEPNHYIEVTPNTEITFSIENGIRFAIAELDQLGNRLGDTGWLDNVSYKTITTQPTTRYIGFNFKKAGDANITPEDVINSNPMLEYSASPTTYEPYQSHLLTVNGEVVLRSLPNGTKDTLNLITGEYEQRIREVVFDGNQNKANWGTVNNENETFIQFYWEDILVSKDITGNDNKVNCDRLPTYSPNELIALSPQKSGVSSRRGDKQGIVFSLLKTDISSFDRDVINKYFAQNPVTIQHELTISTTKSVALDSTYYFQPVMNREVYVDGSILPLVCSVTIPTETLSFVINPNEEDDKTFIAPEFTITNHNRIPIYLELKSFTQITDVMNDVLPNQYENWEELNQAQSKDIALALVPKPSEGWKILVEGERYVADASNYYLGEIKAKSSVDFTFTASHGFAFIEAIQPQYRLSFVFDFFER